ncbi:hypothetical protein CYMTET_2955 [Cymbomonas tetramitiformis]|uniref:Uncharacterized protein n=1 Tax=Cymbomonas tetramitiformis TaxID=36881 RepID=A0AAE0LM15_9CHLO|nr:hypothetical protein CYMTET_2955 [Cymbomonas tetramitiformis]
MTLTLPSADGQGQNVVVYQPILPRLLLAYCSLLCNLPLQDLLIHRAFNPLQPLLLETMGFFRNDPVVVKVKLACTPQVRKMTLTKGVNTPFHELMDLAASRFQGVQLQPTCQFLDADGDQLTVSSDDELRDALEGATSAGSTPIFTMEAAAVKEEDPDAWMVVGSVPSPGEQNPGPQSGSDGLASSNELVFWVNGDKHTLTDPDPSLLLVNYLHSVGLTGTKIGCGEGGCGCCTVTLSKPTTNPSSDAPASEVLSVNSCMRLLCSVDGLEVTTTEGIGSQKEGFHPIQEKIAEGNGSQCGYCTSGWVMNMYSLMESTAEPTASDIEQHFDGNLCRCTGYRPILESFKTFASDGCGHDHSHADACADIEDSGKCQKRCGGQAKACAYKRAPPLSADVAQHRASAKLLHFKEAASGDQWFRPLTLSDLATIQAALPSGADVKLVCANTSIGVAKYFPVGTAQPAPTGPKVTIDIKDVVELQAVSEDAQGMTVGGVVTIAKLITAMEGSKWMTAASDPASSPFGAAVRHLKRVANVQVRNAGSWAGNLMLTKNHPAFGSDIVTVFSALGVTLQVGAADGTRSLMSMEDFFDADLTGKLILAAVLPSNAPAPGSVVHFHTFKTAQRHVNAHAIVNAGFNIVCDAATGKVSKATVVFNGVAKKLLFAHKTEQALIGSPLNTAALTAALAAAHEDVATTGASLDPRHTPDYRNALVDSFVYKLFLHCQASLDPRIASALTPFAAAEDRPVSSGVRSYDTDPAEFPVSKALPKLSAQIQASGEASYVSTMQPAQGLHAAIVYSTKANAKIVTIDPSPALTMPGVKDFVAKADIPAGGNTTLMYSELVFFAAGDTSPCIGVMLGLVLADTHAHALAAAKKVHVVYGAVGGKAGGSPPITSLTMAKAHHTEAPFNQIDAAMRELVMKGGHKRRGLHPRTIPSTPEWVAAVKDGRNPLDVKQGNPAAVIARARGGSNALSSVSTLKGVAVSGAQRHFYMEPQTTFVIPQEDGRLEVWCSTQDAALTQTTLGAVLGIPAHKINVKMRRGGGGFGGKLSRHLPLAAAVAVAALKHGVQVHGLNERVDDLTVTGGREAMEVDYDVAYTSDGIINSLSMTLNIDAGWSLSDTVGDQAMGCAFADNVYFTEHFEAKGNLYYTNTPLNTSQRAPGVVQSILAHETVLEHVAHELGLPMSQVQEANFYKVGESTPAGEIIGSDTFNWTIPTLWGKLKTDAKVAERQQAVDAFNKANRWKKRGLASTPTKYIMGIDFYHSGATVNVYPDGSVEIAHGGAEVGQGINTKAAQVAAYTLGCPLESVIVSDLDTSKVPNNTCTGGSGTSECTSAAVKEACATVAQRLAKYTSAGKSWADAVTAAITDAVCLSATGWYVAPKPEHGASTYATYGACCSEVEIDVLTGEVQVLRTDIVMDQGTSLNPDIDIGQIEGGFIMALGYVLTEEVLIGKEGEQLNLGTWEYKIPSAYDIPIEFNVQLLKATPNPSGVLHSKASAEPVMATVSSVYFAVKNAMYAARAEKGVADYFSMSVPITVQKIQQGCMVTHADFKL